jgi:hypothetical protein
VIPTAPSRRLHHHRPHPPHPLRLPSGASRALRPNHLAAATTVLVTVLSAAGCHVDREGFNQRVFACDTAAPDPACGTDENGRRMACFAARQIGASDFCTKTCDAPGPTIDGICLPGGESSDNDSRVELRSCRPSDDTETTPHAACHQSGLGCYRTDLLSDEGVCMTLNPCDQDGDCRDPVRSVCATSFLSTTIYPESNLPLDHMFCLQTNCKSRGTSCSPGETCLQEVVPPEAHAADICVPNCDSHQRCPPNFLCYKKASTSVAPNVCIPGLLGFTCDSAIDCMVGTCNSTGIGYNVCTTTCGGEADCQRFDGEQGSFSCIKNPADPTQLGVCQTPDAYRGSICNDTADCVDRNPEEVCMRVSPSDAQGVCLKPCPEDGSKCKPRGGINHTCLPSFVNEMGPASACFPGYLGYPCEDESNCVGDLRCLPSFPDAPNVCSASCGTDADCVRHKPGRTGSRWASDDTSWCGAGAPLNNPICLPGRVLPDGSPCPSSNACASGKCTNGLCAPATL